MKYMGRSVMIMMSVTSIALSAGAETPSSVNDNRVVLTQKSPSPSETPREQRGIVQRTWDSAVEVAQGAWNAVTGWFKGTKDSSKSS